MRTVFGIDVSKASSEVAILVNGERVHGYTMSNDIIGFSRLQKDLKTVRNPEIIFEATGVYSRRLQAFLEENSYDYTRLIWKLRSNLMDCESGKPIRSTQRNLLRHNLF